MGIDTGVGAEHAQHELFLGHLEREDADGLASSERRVLRNVETEGRLAHGRPRGHDDQVALLQAARAFVEVSKARRHAGDQLARLRELVDGAEALLDDVADADEPLANAALGDVEDGLFRAIEQLGDLLLALIARLHDAAAGVDQAAQHSLLLDDAAPVLDVGDARQTIEQAGQVGRAAGRFKQLPPAQLVLEGHQVDGLAALR